jgi:putative transposase
MLIFSDLRILDDSIYGPTVSKRLKNMDIKETKPAYRSPWQNPYCARIIGSIRRDCLDHVIIVNEAHLRRILGAYFDYYHRCRTHLGLDKDCPKPRGTDPPAKGKVIAFPKIGGLHNLYARKAA